MNKNGFTLVELLIALSVGLVVMAAIYSLSEMGQRSSVSISQKVVTQQDARAVLDLMAMEIRMASYNPTQSLTVWETFPLNTGGAGCAAMGITAAQRSRFRKGIQAANPNSIVIAMDLDGNGSVGCCATCTDASCANYNERIMYSYDSANKQIIRRLGCEGDTILGGAAGSGTTVENNAAGVSMFTYWGPDIDHPDASGNCPDIDITAYVGSANAATATKWIPQIRSVVITIVADNELEDKTTKKKRRMTYSTAVIVRNHVLSPPIAN